MKKKGTLGGIFAMALILALTFVLSVGSVSAAEPTIGASGDCGKDGSNVTWTLDSTGLLTISGTGAMADYMPSTPWGNGVTSVVIKKGVTHIGNYAFNECRNLTSVVLPDSVTSIGDFAFVSCTGLKSVTIPKSVTSIGNSAFVYCTSLTGITIPKSVTSIGDRTFAACAGLTSIVLPDSVKSIGEYAFTDCTALTGITIPKSVTSIGDYAFMGCTGLTSITIPEGVTALGNSAFLGCENLKEIRYNAKEAADLTGMNGAFGDAGASAGGVKVIFGESVKKIPSNIFSNCESLTSVTIGSNVTSIGDNAFLGCRGLVEINYNARAAECTEDSFDSGNGLKVVFGDSVEKIPGYIFQDCPGLTSVTIGDNVTAIGYYAFNRCTGLTSIKIPVSLTNVDYKAFSGCVSLADVYYGGTERQWNAITIYEGNDRLLQANRHCAGKESIAAPTVKATYMGTTGKPYIKWNAVTGADKYEVYRATSRNGTYTLLGTTTATNYTDNKAGSGYTYYYKVKALAANGIESDYSAVVAGICHCAKPTVKATYMGATGKPYIRWNAVANVSKYEVYRATSKNGTYTLLGTTTDTNYTDNKAGSGYTYYYKVRAISKVKSSANSVFSTPVAGICHCAKPTVKATYMGTTGKPYIRWNAVANVSKYEVYRATSKDGTYTLLGTTTATNYTDNKAGTGYTYYYKVKAISKVKSSANSVFSTPVAGICHCAKPTVKVAATSAGKPRLTWNAVAGASKYEVYRATSKNGTYTKMYTTTRTSYTNTSAKAGTTYYYKVKAVSKVKSSANSVFSTAVSITVK